MTTFPISTEIQDLVRPSLKLLHQVKQLHRQSAQGRPISHLRARKALRHIQLALQYAQQALDSAEGEAFPISPTEVAARQVQQIDHSRASGGRESVPPVEPMSSQKGIQGTTETMALTDLITWLTVQERDGVLRIQAPREVITLVFQSGELIHAGSNHSPPGSRLGEILVDQGAITKDELVEFLYKYTMKPQRLGDALHCDELVSHEQLQTALETQVQMLFQRLLTLDEASFVFRDGLPSDAGGQVRLNVAHLILESARFHDESATPDQPGA